MKNLRLAIGAVALMLALGTRLAADIAGTWTSAFDSQIGRQEYTYTFVNVGTKLTGTIYGVEVGTTKEIVATRVK